MTPRENDVFTDNPNVHRSSPLPTTTIQPPSHTNVSLNPDWNSAISAPPQPTLCPYTAVSHNAPATTRANQQFDDITTATFEVFQPLFDPEMLGLFPNGELPDLAHDEMSDLNLDYLDFL